MAKNKIKPGDLVKVIRFVPRSMRKRIAKAAHDKYTRDDVERYYNRMRIVGHMDKKGPENDWGWGGQTCELEEGMIGTVTSKVSRTMVRVMFDPTCHVWVNRYNVEVVSSE